MLTSKNYKVLLFDIEGTTTSISFVKEVLFLYVRTNLRQYLSEEWQSPELQADIEALRRLTTDQLASHESSEGLMSIGTSGQGEVVEAVVNNVMRWMDLDKKLTALKTLQGHMWSRAYSQGKLVGHLYEDTAVTFRELVSRGLKIYIYSSGSVEAQKLLFGHSVDGDLTQLISGYFDTTIGLKTDPNSYSKIAASMSQEPASVLFLTDIEQEACAAREAGMGCMLVVREGNAPLGVSAKQHFKHIHKLTELL